MMEYEALKKLSKLDIHCHLDGSLSLQFVREQLGKEIPLSDLQVAEDCKNLAEYLEKFEIPLKCLQSEAGLRMAGYDFIRSVVQENIRYVEVRFAPMLSVHDGLTSERVIQSVLEGLEKGKQEYGVEYNVIVCAMRHQPEEQNRKMLKSARLFLGEGVCAADLAGNEAAFPMSGFRNLFSEVKKMDMPFTLHAGECGSAQNIIDSIDVGAARIGHGIAMRQRPDVQKLCREKRVGIEMCPISNLQTRAAGCPEEYPLREFLDAGLFVTVNTDNRSVSGTSITKELEFIQKTYNIRDDEVERLLKNAVEISFADDSVKHRLLTETGGKVC